MKYIFQILLSGLLSATLVSNAQVPPEIQDPWTIGENKLPPRTVIWPSPTIKAGEWNSYDITCKGSTIELRVNGKLQNVATDCSVTKGGIGLQAEGSKIQFRNLWVEPIK